MKLKWFKKKPEAIVPVNQEVDEDDLGDVNGEVSEVVPQQHSDPQVETAHAGVLETLTVLDQVARLGGYDETKKLVEELLKHIETNYNNPVGHNIRGTYREVLNHMKYPTVASYGVHLRNSRVKLNDFVLLAVFLDIAVHVHTVDKERNVTKLLYSLNAQANKEQKCFHVTVIDKFLFTHLNTNPLITADEARLRDALEVDAARLRRALGDKSAQPYLFTEANPYALQGALGVPQLSEVTFEGRKAPGFHHQVGQRVRTLFLKKH